LYASVVDKVEDAHLIEVENDLVFGRRVNDEPLISSIGFTLDESGNESGLVLFHLLHDIHDYLDQSIDAVIDVGFPHLHLFGAVLLHLIADVWVVAQHCCSML
ncbi:hypothetical protein PFISCL1PPCAC_11268, partial [Pristionchus fissidentatus]